MVFVKAKLLYGKLSFTPRIRWVVLYVMLIMGCFSVSIQMTFAQGSIRLHGEPPDLSLITIRQGFIPTEVIIEGAQNAIFANATVYVRNMNTGDTAVTRAGITGMFSITVRGLVTDPYAISPSVEGFNTESNPNLLPDSLPGGPAAILFPNDADGYQFGGTLSDASILGRDVFWSATMNPAVTTWGAGERLTFEIPVTFTTSESPDSGIFSAQIAWIPIATLQADGNLRAVPDVTTGNGWSTTFTPSGLPIHGVYPARASADMLYSEVFGFIRDEVLVFRYEMPITETISAGLYTPTFTGYYTDSDGQTSAWTEVADQALQLRLPFVFALNLPEDDLPVTQLPFLLWMDDPSDGSRGVLPEEDQDWAGLSNHVRFNSPTYILPPNGENNAPYYSLEPYVPNQFLNQYRADVVPLIPFDETSGSLSITVARPDESVTRFENIPILGAQRSSILEDEATRFGVNSPVDLYQFATFNRDVSRFVFDQYGLYTVTAQGMIQDLQGHEYQGGGTYSVLIAEPIDMMPDVLSGTPFHVGDLVATGLHLLPHMPAEVSVQIQIFPADGAETIEYTYSGTANDFGVFQAETPFITLDVVGEYLIDYEARYTDAQGRLWAGSLRSAGAISEVESNLVVHGERGFIHRDEPYSQARYLTQVFDRVTSALTLNFPFFSGDVLTLRDGNDAIRPSLSWTTYPPENDIHETTSELNGYAYVSAVRPDVSARQFVTALPMQVDYSWTTQDPYNQQLGAGALGDFAGDYHYLFANIVNADAQVGGYASLSLVTRTETSPAVMSPYRGSVGDADRGPLMRINNTDVDYFFLPTTVRAGDLYFLNQPLQVVGYATPPIQSEVFWTVTAPSGTQYQGAGETSSIGWFTALESVTADEVGVWEVAIEVRPNGQPVDGVLTNPNSGSLLGEESVIQRGSYHIYVLPPDFTPLPWNAVNSSVQIPPALAYNFNFVAPETWTSYRAMHTLTTAGWILADDTLPLNGRSLSYAYNATNLTREYSQIEVLNRTSGLAASDVRSLIFVLVGTDAQGTPQITARAFTMFHDRLVSLMEGGIP